ncbi:hypothetical protein [Methanosarcina horonobensis]|uniref:hypothetical protein n=1 Tax=Methanosarcina horonobensis TaxID=418008 RepID=UPI000B0763A7|nr:hypothetical protein [Methanosarcina horonobensis]
MRFGVLGSNNIYVRETTAEISNFFHVDAIILKKKEEKCNIDSEKKINLKFIDSKSLFSLLRLPFAIKKDQ